MKRVIEFITETAQTVTREVTERQVDSVVGASQDEVTRMLERLELEEALLEVRIDALSVVWSLSDSAASQAFEVVERGLRSMITSKHESPTARGFRVALQHVYYALQVRIRRNETPIQERVFAELESRDDGISRSTPVPADLLDQSRGMFEERTSKIDFGAVAARRRLTTARSRFDVLRRKPPQGQEVITTQGGAAKRGIGGVPLLLLMLIGLGAAQSGGSPISYAATLGFTAATSATVVSLAQQQFAAGWYAINLDVSSTGSSSAIHGMCQLCMNNESPMSIPAAGAVSESNCAAVVVTSLQNTVIWNDAVFVPQLYLDPIFDFYFNCQFTSAVTTTVRMGVTLVPIEVPASLKTARAIAQHSEWKRDLTREGVEPNPGPKRANRSGGGKFKAWLAAHPAWQNKPEAEALEVYRAAKEASKESAKVQKPAPAHETVRSAVKEARASKVNLLDNPYTRCVLDPFHASPARVPDHAGQPTALFQLKQTIALEADTNGRACVFLRPGVGEAIAYSGAMSDASIHWSSSPGVAATAGDLPRMVFAARSTSGLLNYWNDANGEQIKPPLNSEEAFCAQSFFNFDKTFEMVGLFGSTRTVAAGLSFRNIANKFEQQGRMVGVAWDGDLGAPGFGNATLNIGRTDPQTGVPSGPTGVTFANVVNLDTSVQSKGADGMTIHMVKTGDRAITDFRQTAPTPTYENPVANAIWHRETSVVVSDPIPFAPAVCDSAVTQRFVDMVAGLNPAVSTTGKTRSTAPADSDAVAWMDDVPLGVTDYSCTSLYGAKLSETTVAGTDNSTLNVDILRLQMDRLLHSHSTSAMSPGDCGLLVVIEGLKPTTKVADGATGRYIVDQLAEPFEVEIVCVFEAIPRTGTVKIGQESKARMMPAKAELAAPLVRRAAMEAIGVIPVAHPGAHETEMDNKGRTSSAAPVADWFKGAFNTVEGWVKDASQFMQKNPWIAEAAESLFAFMV